MENTIYEEIVRNSLQYVACIDDDFVNPYEVQESSEHLEFTKDMYTTIEETCGSHVEMLRYEKEMDTQRIAKCISNKDLLILDWNLVGEDFLPTLRILAEADEMQIPFVCIYTKQPDTENIYQIIKSYFSGYSMKQVEELFEEWTDAGIMESDFKPVVLELFSSEKKNMKKIIQRVKDVCGDSEEALKKLEYKNPDSWYPLGLKWTNAVLPETSLSKAFSTKTGALVINGMLVCCFAKPESHKKEAVDISDLIPAITKEIISVPNRIFNLVWLKYANELRKVLQSRTRFFSGITDSALGYLSKELLDQGETVYDDWLRGLFQDEIMDRWEGADFKLPLEILDDIKNKYQNIEPGNIVDDLAELNEKITVNHFFSNSKHHIEFGDVFVTLNADGQKEDYWMCVTAKCECLRPESKIENNYLFIKGTKIKKSTALRNAESQYRSFLKKDEIVCVEWKIKLISVYFESGKNIIDGVGKSITGVYRGENLNFTYVCNVKENYAQRMANAAFAEGNKVGITLAQIKEEESQK